MDISKVDKNFNVEKTINEDKIVFYDCEEEPFKIYGVMKEGDRFCRIPSDIAKSVSENVEFLNNCNAGGRVRFVTNSRYVAIRAYMGQMEKSSHFALTGSAGLDMYIKTDKDFIYGGTFRPPYDIVDGYESIVYIDTNINTEVVINLPLYSNVKKLFVGIEEGSRLLPSEEYKHKKPVVYYGSSITQGGCASRPGCSYQSIISRRLDTDYINLGFSGSALAEDEIINYIKGLDMSVFVLDYDHNAPNCEHLEKTHEKMFKAIRRANPNLPIIIMPRPRYYLTMDEQKRRGIVRQTYLNAVAEGDKNVYYIDGCDLMRFSDGEGLVDGCHPNDLGFFSMADAVEKVLKNLI